MVVTHATRAQVEWVARYGLYMLLTGNTSNPSGSSLYACGAPNQRMLPNGQIEEGDAWDLEDDANAPHNLPVCPKCLKEVLNADHRNFVSMHAQRYTVKPAATFLTGPGEPGPLPDRKGESEW